MTLVLFVGLLIPLFWTNVCAGSQRFWKNPAWNLFSQRVILDVHVHLNIFLVPFLLIKWHDCFDIHTLILLSKLHHNLTYAFISVSFVFANTSLHWFVETVTIKEHEKVKSGNLFILQLPWQLYLYWIYISNFEQSLLPSCAISLGVLGSLQ